MPESEPPANNRSKAKPRQESRHADALHWTPSTDREEAISGPAAGLPELQLPGESLLGSDFSQSTFDRHAALLGDSRLSHPANSIARIRIAQQLQRDYGNQYVQRLVKHISRQRAEAVQAKLTVGSAGDKYEQEADRIAKELVASSSPPNSEAVQRQGEEEEELQMKPQLEQRVGAEGGGVDREFEQSIQQARGHGQPLPDEVRSSIGGALGADLSEVRVHTGSESDALNDSVSARAFTTGQDVFFAEGEYDPGSAAGREILAHELVQVVQQGGVQRVASQENLTPGAGPIVQRHPEGTELPNAGADAAEIGEKEQAAPPTTRTTETEEAEQQAATEAGSDEPGDRGKGSTRRLRRIKEDCAWDGRDPSRPTGLFGEVRRSLHEGRYSPPRRQRMAGRGQCPR